MPRGDRGSSDELWIVQLGEIHSILLLISAWVETMCQIEDEEREHHLVEMVLELVSAMLMSRL